MTDRRAGPGGLTEVHQKYYLYHYSHLHLTFLILKRSLMIAKTNLIFFHVGAEGLRRAGPRDGLITRTHTRKKHINILQCDFISAAADPPDLAAITYIAIVEIIYNKHDITNKYVTEWHPGSTTVSIHQRRYLESRSEHDTWYFYFFIIDNQHLNNKNSGISTFYSNNSKFVGFLVFEVFEQKELLVMF